MNKATHGLLLTCKGFLVVRALGIIQHNSSPLQNGTEVLLCLGLVARQFAEPTSGPFDLFRLPKFRVVTRLQIHQNSYDHTKRSLWF
jgi:hypothetical protein